MRKQAAKELLSFGNSCRATVFLHGVFGSSRDFADLIDPITRRTQRPSIAMDLLNHGSAPAVFQRMSYSDLAENVKDRIDEMKLGKVDLVGHSMGGKVAQALLLKYPDRFARVVILDTAPFVYNHSAGILKLIQRLSEVNMVDMKSAEELSANLATTFKDAPFISQLVRNTNINAEGRLEWNFNVPAIAQNCFNIVCAEFPPKKYVNAESSDKAVLFIKGEKSKYIEGESLEAAKKVFPNARFETVQGTGHLLHLEKPEQVINLISDELCRAD
jgi:esterase